MSTIKVTNINDTSNNASIVTGNNAFTVNGTVVTGVSAGSVTVTAEGGSTTTNLQQGLAKAWTFCTDNVITDSLNASSSADDATGAYTITLSNNTATANVAGNVSCNENINLIGHRSANSTSTYKIRLKDTNGAGGDGNSGATLHGDLA